MLNARQTVRIDDLMGAIDLGAQYHLRQQVVPLGAPRPQDSEVEVFQEAKAGGERRTPCRWEWHGGYEQAPIREGSGLAQDGPVPCQIGKGHGCLRSQRRYD